MVQGSPSRQSLRLRVTLALVSIIALTVIAFSALTFRAFDRALVPELRQRTEILGTIILDDFQRALELGIPINSVAGFDDKVAEIVAEFPEVQRVRIVSRDGTELLDIDNGKIGPEVESGLGFHAWKSTSPVLVGSKVVAEIELTGNPRLIEARLLRVLIDIGVIGLAIILFGVEVIIALAARVIWLPREALTRLLEDQRQGRFDRVISVPPESPLMPLAERLNDRAMHISQDVSTPARLEVSLPITARLPVFLLALGTETTASFLPVMAANSKHISSIPAGAAAAMPLVLYLLIAAALAPVAGRFVRRIGPRQAFSWSVLPILAGLAGMALSSNLLGISLGRMFVGAGYTLANVACSVYMLRAGGRGVASQTQTSLNTALYGGVLAGSVIGGITAFEAGYAAAILFGVGATGVASLVARWSLSGPAGIFEHSMAPSSATPASGRMFSLVVVCLAIPASASMAMVIWYLMPLILAEEGFDAAMTARIVMLYYLAAILIAPVASFISGAGRFSDRTVAVCGAAIAASALLGAGLVGLTPAIVVTMLGIGHAILRAPLYALVVEASGGQLSWTDHFRMAERLGAVAAFIAAMLVAEQNGSVAIFTMLGLVSFSGAILFAIFNRSMNVGGILQGDD